jgi:hypothetical protein
MGANVTLRPEPGEEQSGEKQISETFRHEDIAKVAYALWESNGCPQGSAECDWLEAERQLRHSKMPYIERERLIANRHC